MNGNIPVKHTPHQEPDAVPAHGSLMPTLHEAHMACVHAVNTAPNEAIHRHAEQYLSAWRDGVAEALAWDGADRGAFLMEADNHYLNQPEHAGRPMCGGVWLDWTPCATTEP